MNAATSKIEYRNENGSLSGTMHDVAKDRACIIAQKYLAQFPDLTANISTATTEQVVSVATEWQKRNG